MSFEEWKSLSGCFTTNAYGITGDTVSRVWVQSATCGGRSGGPHYTANDNDDFDRRCREAGGTSMIACTGDHYCTCKIAGIIK